MKGAQPQPDKVPKGEEKKKEERKKDERKKEEKRQERKQQKQRSTFTNNPFGDAFRNKNQ